MNNKIKFFIIGLALGALGVYVAISAFTYSLPTNKSQELSNTLDAHFIEQMIPHHEDAITMAKIAQEKAKRPEIKKLAENIISSQGKEISQMKDWYRNWFGRELPTDNKVMQHHGMRTNTPMHMGIRGDASDMSRLTEAEDFDTAFIEHMIPHHQMAIMMANMLKDRTTRPEMKKLADDIINAQSKEIEEMRSWLREWEN